MFSEPADGERPVHTIWCEWILSGARERKPSEYPTPFLSRYREVISSRPAVLIAAAGSYLQRWKRVSFPNQGGTANLSSLYGWSFVFDRKLTPGGLRSPGAVLTSSVCADRPDSPEFHSGSDSRTGRQKTYSGGNYYENEKSICFGTDRSSFTHRSFRMRRRSFRRFRRRRRLRRRFL